MPAREVEALVHRVQRCWPLPAREAEDEMQGVHAKEEECQQTTLCTRSACLDHQQTTIRHSEPVGHERARSRCSGAGICQHTKEAEDEMQGVHCSGGAANRPPYAPGVPVSTANRPPSATVSQWGASEPARIDTISLFGENR